VRAPCLVSRRTEEWLSPDNSRCQQSRKLAVLHPGEVLSVGVRIEQLVDKPRELL
jgi:hypothetical protein